jgi:hypothetical protein
MRTLLVSIAMLVVACGGGGSDTPDADPLGADCSMGQSCGPYTCVENVCTNACTSSDDCRGGTECRDVGGSFSCVDQRWEGGEGQFHTNCGIDHDICADGFSCIFDPDSDVDPYAYCTTECADDRDCPAEYTCTTLGGAMQCQRNSNCSPCTLDEECQTPRVPDGKCVMDATLGSKVCSKACTAGGESCDPAFECIGDGDDAACVHMSGSCESDGSMCAPCATDADCADTPNSTCLELYFSHEKFCSTPCPCTAPFFCANVGGLQRCVPPNEWNNSCAPYWQQ